MGRIDYKAIFEQNQDEWKALTRDPQKYEALLAGHYSDSNHFVYELLQNAEDAFDKSTGVSASKVVIEYYPDKLVFYHNGKPFDEADVRGVSSMLMGTKDRDDAQTIGRFGMGFKSVFKYTYQPEIYSDDEAFKITNYLLPVEITDGWDYETEKKSIICKLGEGRSFVPFSKEEHLTKIVIPFQKYDKDGGLVPVPGDDVLKKLDELDGEILLFLSHIQNLYWVNKETGKFDLDIWDVDRWIHSNLSQGLYGLGNKFIAEKSGIWKEELRKTLTNPCNIKNFKYGIQTNFDIFKYIMENKESRR